MKNVLLVWMTPGKPKQHGFALVSSNLLRTYPLDEIDGVILNIYPDPDPDVGKAIEELYQRLGLEASEGDGRDDLAAYVNKPLLFVPDQIIKFGWAF